MQLPPSRSAPLPPTQLTDDTLGDVADGYLWLGRRTDLTGVRFIQGFITPENIARIEPRWRHDHPLNRPYTKEEMEEAAADNWRHLQDAFK